MIEDNDLSPELAEKLQQELNKIKQKAQHDTGVNYDKAYATANKSDRKNDKLYDLGREAEISENEDSRTVRQSNEEHMNNTPLPNPSGLDF